MIYRLDRYGRGFNAQHMSCIEHMHVLLTS